MKTIVRTILWAAIALAMNLAAAQAADISTTQGTATITTADVTVRWNEVRQRIDGFGACDAWFGGRFRDSLSQGLLNPVDQEGIAFTTTKRLWTLGNFSRHVRPGWVRIDADARPAPEVYLAAFRHPDDGSCVVVLINGGAATEVTVRLTGAVVPEWIPEVTSAELDLAEQAPVPGRAAFMARLPAKSVVTYRGRAIR